MIIRRIEPEDAGNVSALIVIKGYAKTLDADPDIRRDVIKSYTQEGQDMKGYGEKSRRIFPVAKLSGVMYNFYVKELEAEKKKEKPVTVADGYKASAVVDGINKILSRQVNFKQASAIVAMSVALQEIEEKGGVNAVVEPKSFHKRMNELLKDPTVKAIGQSMSSPFRGKELERAINMSSNREQAVAKELNGMYRQRLAEKQQQEDLKETADQNDLGGPAMG